MYRPGPEPGYHPDGPDYSSGTTVFRPDGPDYSSGTVVHNKVRQVL